MNRNILLALAVAGMVLAACEVTHTPAKSRFTAEDPDQGALDFVAASGAVRDPRANQPAAADAAADIAERAVDTASKTVGEPQEEVTGEYAGRVDRCSFYRVNIKGQERLLMVGDTSTCTIWQ